MLTIQKWPPLRALMNEPRVARLMDSVMQHATGAPDITWSEPIDDVLEDIGNSLCSVLTRTERARFGTVYLDLIGLVLELNALTCAVPGGMLVLLPMGLTQLTLLNAAGYEALSRLADFATAIERDVWPERFHANVALRTFGEGDSLTPLRPDVRDAVTRCVRAVSEFDDLLRIAALGTISGVENFPKSDFAPDSWQFSDGLVSRIQWLFVVAHELGHLDAGDCSDDASTLRSLVPGHAPIRVFDFAEHKKELRADRWAARVMSRWAAGEITDDDLSRPLPGRGAGPSSPAAAPRHLSKFMIGTPLDFLFFIMRGLDDVHRFHECRTERRANRPDPPLRVGTHPDGPTRRKNVSRIIGAARPGGTLDEVFELVNLRREEELNRLVPAAPPRLRPRAVAD